MRRSGGDSAGAGRVGRVGVRGHGSGGGAGARVGHSSVMVRALFSLAQKIQPCIIFFDEADGLCLKREEGDSGADRYVSPFGGVASGRECGWNDRKCLCQQSFNEVVMAFPPP